MPQVGNKIKNIRQALGLTQKEFAKALEITPPGLSQIEKGKRNPSFATLLKLKNNIHASIDEILRDDCYDCPIHGQQDSSDCPRC